MDLVVHQSHSHCYLNYTPGRAHPGRNGCLSTWIPLDPLIPIIINCPPLPFKSPHPYDCTKMMMRVIIILSI